MRNLATWSLCIALSGLYLNCGSSTSSTADLAVNADLAVARDLSTSPDLLVTSDLATAIVYNNCTDAIFVDQSVTGASRTVAFGVGGNVYSPRCILIAAGQTVTFSGTFANHPLRPGVGATATTGSPNNPIMSTMAGTTATFTFPTAGQYPFNCSFHDGSGMNGVVRVK